MIFLLDVNVLLAMRYDDHVHSERVDRWVSHLAAEDGRDHAIFATCPITELFIPDQLPARHLPTWVRKSEQTTDGYLLALAKSHDGRLATLDRFIPGSVVIPEETSGPLMVREPAYSELMGRSGGIELR